ncbi:MAG: prolipoprotein diacylglyceryl transferase [Ruminococcaceae bacterium]|nr:prolipoprotein diacylglyceryl transferase [Oscillospiraceae bacterium]
MLEKMQGTPLGETWYTAFQVIGIAVAVLFGLWYQRKYICSIWKSALTLVFVYAMIFIWVNVHFMIETGFTGMGTRSIVRALPYLPVIAFPPAVLLKIKWRKVCDFLAPIICLSTGISLFGCVFAGCCGGYPSKFGIYSFYYGGNAFPIQIIEAVAVLMLCQFLLLWNKRRGYNGEGYSLPIMFIIFGSTRFLWEFLRNNEKIWLGCSALSFHALFMAAVGAVWLFVMRKYLNKSIDSKKTKKMKKRR